MTDNMDTRTLRTQIKGINGDVNTFYVQKHLPQCAMRLIVLELNHFLFCHPIF